MKINFQKVDIQMFITTFLLILDVLSKEMTEKTGREETNSGASETNSRSRLYLYGRKESVPERAKRIEMIFEKRWPIDAQRWRLRKMDNQQNI